MPDPNDDRQLGVSVDGEQSSEKSVFDDIIKEL